MVTVLPFGAAAWLVETKGLDEVLGVHARLDADRTDGVVDVVPAARTVLVRFDPSVLSPRDARTWIEEAATAGEGAADRDDGEVELDIRYDGPDLAHAASLLDMTADELVRRHRAARWTVAFTGFAPGFGYLVSDDWPFDVPRLDSPRTRVPVGAVGLAGSFSGAYPRMTPGGWRLIGTTAAPLFDPDAADPALLKPGARVRFTEHTTGHIGSSRGVSRRGSERGPTTTSTPAATPPPVLRILDPGMRATVQDLGRPGHAGIGVAGSGALDRSALRLANRLVGNTEGAACIEVTMGGLRALSRRNTWVAVAGGRGAVRIDGREIEPCRAHTWEIGAQLDIDVLSHGARAYVAVRGGIDAPEVLGSRSADSLAGLGPSPLSAGDELPADGAVAGPIPITDVGPSDPRDAAELTVDLAAGPRVDWFGDDALRDLFGSEWTVTNHTDRVGMRLDGPELARTRNDELPSEGMVPGSLQIPPTGRPTILLADGPVTGGYPVIAVATAAALDALAQTRPGDRIRFRKTRPWS